MNYDDGMGQSDAAFGYVVRALARMCVCASDSSLRLAVCQVERAVFASLVSIVAALQLLSWRLAPPGRTAEIRRTLLAICGVYAALQCARSVDPISAFGVLPAPAVNLLHDCCTALVCDAFALFVYHIYAALFKQLNVAAPRLLGRFLLLLCGTQHAIMHAFDVAAFFYDAVGLV